MALPSKMTTAERPKQVDHLEVGNWFWVAGDEPSDYGRKSNPSPVDPPAKKYAWFGCITHVGSNYVKVREPKSDGGYHECRVHFDDVDEELRYEPEPEMVIDRTLIHYQCAVNNLMNEVKAVTASLGVSKTAITDQVGSGNGTDLAVLSETADPNIHKQALIKAKDETLPELFENIKHANVGVAKWMTAETLPMMIEAEGLQGAIGQIEKRIFNISLYAGLTEDVVQIREGATGSYEDRVHLMQRKMYMDEECLVDYKAGGMDIRDIKEFDEWLSKPENMERCLPFNKCAVIFEVRRNRKERSADSNAQAYINIQLAEADKLTFLYIRNGGALYRLSTDIKFEDKMFPDVGAFDLTKPMMASTWGRGGKNFLMPKDEFDEITKENKKKERLCKKWEKDNPYPVWKKEKVKQPAPDTGKWDLSKHGWNYANPHRGGGFGGRSSINGFRGDMHNYKPFDSTNVYYDDVMKDMAEEMEKFNRIALILQGVLDRSPVLHPHPKAETWKPEGFELIFKLVYDASMVLTHGEAPSFEEYWERVNLLADKDSVFIGQQDYWEEKEAVKENNRRDNDYRDRSEYRVERYAPYGNPGPGFVAKPAKWHHRVNKATFSWFRERQRHQRWGERGDIQTHIVIKLEHLFNVSGYKKGDYKQFFQDPRTRCDYIKWAPFLLGAEDYFARLEKENQD